MGLKRNHQEKNQRSNMFFLIPRSKKALFFYISIILLGIIFEYLNLLSAEKTIGICMLIAITFFVVKSILVGHCSNEEKD